MTAPETQLREPIEIINGASNVKLKADPAPAMALIASVAERCIRHHPTLELSTWKTSLKAIRAALEDVQDIYDSAEDRSMGDAIEAAAAKDAEIARLTHERDECAATEKAMGDTIGKQYEELARVEQERDALREALKQIVSDREEQHYSVAASIAEAALRVTPPPDRTED